MRLVKEGEKPRVLIKPHIIEWVIVMAILGGAIGVSPTNAERTTSEKAYQSSN